jgi:hypothetical protein
MTFCIVVALTIIAVGLFLYAYISDGIQREHVQHHPKPLLRDFNDDT